MLKLRSILLVVMFVFVFGVFGTVFAHEGRVVGPYQIYFGWRAEPAYAGQFNGPEVFISPADATPEPGADEVVPDESFASVEVELQAEVTFGDQTITVTFEPAWGEVGHYIADLIPTLPGDYSFHLTGTIGDTPVDETFTSADGQFSTVEPSIDVMFPSAQSLEARVADLEARLAQLEATVEQLQGS